MNIETWELEKASQFSTETIKNYIWMATANRQPVPGCISVDALRAELVRRGENPVGFHNA